MGDNFPKPGGIFQNRYRIGSVIGHGGFAQIYQAEQIDLGRQVALKVLNPGLRGNDAHAQEVVERFRREAKLVASLRDPHTITMHDYGRTDDALLYMVFEYIDGRTFSGLVRDEGKISARRTVKILRQCLSSLQEAHALGVLHRDIKPANIMVYEHIGRTDQVKVLDFGIAKSVLAGEESSGHDLTQAGMIIGTPRYMAPEQLRGTPLGPQTDLYSLGLVAYELLAGQKAIELDSMVSIITRQVSNDPIQLPENIGISPRLAALVNGMLHKSERERFQNAGEVLRALDALSEQDLDGGAPVVPRRAPPALPTPRHAPAPTPTSAMPARSPALDLPSDFGTPTDIPNSFSDGFSTSGTIPVLKSSKPRSGAVVGLIVLALVLGGAGLFYFLAPSPNSTPITAPATPAAKTPAAIAPPILPSDDEVAPASAANAREDAAKIAQRDTAQAVEMAAESSANEQAQEAQPTPEAARQQAQEDAHRERAPVDTAPAARKPPTPTASTRPAPAKKPQKSRDAEAKPAAPAPAPKKDESSTSSFPALDGI